MNVPYYLKRLQVIRGVSQQAHVLPLVMILVRKPIVNRILEALVTLGVSRHAHALHLVMMHVRKLIVNRLLEVLAIHGVFSADHALPLQQHVKPKHVIQIPIVLQPQSVLIC